MIFLEFGQPPIQQPRMVVLQMLSMLLHEAQKLISEESKPMFVEKAKLIAKDFPDELESFLIDLDTIRPYYKPAAKRNQK